MLAGFAILPSVFAFGLDPASGPKLLFITLPRVFQQMPFGTVAQAAAPVDKQPVDSRVKVFGL